jgi:hypothetical protein
VKLNEFPHSYRRTTISSASLDQIEHHEDLLQSWISGLRRWRMSERDKIIDHRRDLGPPEPTVTLALLLLLMPIGLSRDEE